MASFLIPHFSLECLLFTANAAMVLCGNGSTMLKQMRILSPGSLITLLIIFLPFLARKKKIHQEKIQNLFCEARNVLHNLCLN